MFGNRKIRAQILEELEVSPGQSSQELADALAHFEPDIERIIQNELAGHVRCDGDGRWHPIPIAAEATKLPPTYPETVAVQQGLASSSTSTEKDTSEQQEGSSPSADSIIESALQSLRKRLLDLTGRNRLLNFTHPKKGCIRVIDELPDRLKQQLMDDDRQLRFLPVPNPLRDQLIEAGHIEVATDTQEEKLRHDPSAKEWAQWLGLHTNYEVPESTNGGAAETKHTDEAIQTMLFPDELETRLRTMRQKANSAIEEAGANILYLALGFLEWFESSDQNATKRLAPLYLIPVRLERGKLNQATRTYEYRLGYSGEDVLTNISLREKLRNDFAIALPELEEGTDPERYLEIVADAVKAREPNWAVRRYVTLAHLNFSKQLLYRDLDPANWPAGESILKHQLVRQCLAGLAEDNDGENDPVHFGEEYPIDDIEDIHERYPLILDADSSQHSAMIDAVGGKNLVIEGPPGTGKSQTITNLIAAAIANQKRVLFVAEKAAALEVVKRRLDQAGLGAFCLELHSHRSHKRLVLDDIAARIRLSGKLRRPEEIETDIKRYEGLREELRKHAELVNSKWKHTNLTVHNILCAATRYRQELSIPPDRLHPTAVNGDNFTSVERKKILGHAKTLAVVYTGVMEQLGDIDSIGEHPWFGIRNTALQAYEQERVVSQLTNWHRSLEKVKSELLKLSTAVSCNSTDLPSRLSKIRQLSVDLQAIPDCKRSDPLFALPKLRGDDTKAFCEAIQNYKDIQSLYEDLAQHLEDETVANAETGEAAIASIRWLSKVGSAHLSLVQLKEHLQLASSLVQIASELREPIEFTNKELSLAGKNELRVCTSGIAEFAQVAEIVAKLEPENLRHRSETFEQDELDQVIPKLRRRVELLKAERSELTELYDLKLATDLKRIREIEAEFRQSGYFSWLNGNWRQARADLKALRASKSVRANRLWDNLKDLAEFVAAKDEFESDEHCRSLLGVHFEGLETNIERIADLRAWYRMVREEYGVGFGTKVAVGDTIIGVSEGLARALRSMHKRGLKTQAERLASGLDQLAKDFPGLSRLNNPVAILDSESGDLATLRESLAEHLQLACSAFKDECIPLRDVTVIAERWEQFIIHLRNWRAADICNKYLEGKVELHTGVGTTDQEVLESIERLALTAEVLIKSDFPDGIAEKVYAEPSKTTAELIKLRNRMLTDALAEEKREYAAFKDAVDLDEAAWAAKAGDDLDALMHRNARATENPQWLANWLEYLRARAQLHQLGWPAVSVALESKDLLPQQLEAAVSLGATDVLSREILSETPELGAFSGLTQESIKRQFQECDRRLRSLQRQAIAWRASKLKPPSGNSSGRVRDFSELALLKNEIGKKARHIPLRQLMQRSGQAISALKPCFMMGPMSVAQYLAPGIMKFDLVVMDEASQVRPEDALGAIARGGQLVVVGDPKQLPPTSFFDKLLDEEDEEENFTTAQQSESILDAALTSLPARRLRWHYRSQHESLIAFSNHAFYGSDLIIFPSPINKAPEYGVQLTRVKRGRFVNRVNREEASLIAKAVRQHMLSHPKESIGVVAMNAQQREQIERSIEYETKEDPQFRKLIEQNQDTSEPLFVKNLENVQGDERAVIYISMTYGPTEVDGRVAQRFGPINSIHGWRRLNVLFTRSKKRMRVFSSMDSDDVVITPTSSRGVKSLKSFLDYAAHGYLSSTVEHTARDPDSDFEVAVADALSNHGFECVPQVGVAGYFLDIAIKDPGNSGRYLMAIECDGATYHSAKSTRDRDQLRQSILEGLGWRMRRIWSTDWFNNPVGQLAPIVKELNELKTIPAASDSRELDEIEEIDEIEEEMGMDTELVSTIVHEQVDLRTKLETFDKEVIRQEQPETPDERRLLRSPMLDALVTYLPTTVWEFQQRIPPYLRERTAPAEGKYITPVLEIIYESEGAFDESAS